MVLTEEFCQKLPKVELHAHLNGSLSQETLKLLGVSQELFKDYQIINNSPENRQEKLNACFKLFKIAHSATTTVELVYTATKQVIDEFYKDNVIYLELRTTPRQEQNMTKEEYITAVVRAIQDNKSPIIVKLILSIDRTHDQLVSEEALNLIVELHKTYPYVIKGVDLSGNPNQGSFLEQLFIRARKNGLKVTLHCAEVRNVEETLRMLKFKPDRIGHATCIHPSYGGSNEIWKLYCNAQIPAECCLTSNLLCGTSDSYKGHHIREWLKHGLPFSVNTDDKGVFNTSLSEEYYLAAKNHNLPESSLVNCSFSAIESSFASPEEKVQLKSFLLNWKNQNSELFKQSK